MFARNAPPTQEKSLIYSNNFLLRRDDFSFRNHNTKDSRGEGLIRADSLFEVGVPLTPFYRAVHPALQIANPTPRRRASRQAIFLSARNSMQTQCAAHGTIRASLHDGNTWGETTWQDRQLRSVRRADCNNLRVPVTCQAYQTSSKRTVSARCSSMPWRCPWMSTFPAAKPRRGSKRPPHRRRGPVNPLPPVTASPRRDVSGKLSTGRPLSAPLDGHVCVT